MQVMKFYIAVGDRIGAKRSKVINITAAAVITENPEDNLFFGTVITVKKIVKNIFLPPFGCALF